MNKLTLPLFFIFIFFCAYFSWTYVRTTPQYSLFMAYRAVGSRDYEAFTKYVDVDKIIDTYVTQKFKIEEGEKRPDNFLLQLGNKLISTLRRNMQPTAVNATKVIVKKGVESGTLFSLYKPHTVFAMLITAKVIQDNDDVRVELVEKDKQIITLKMRKIQDHWQVYEVSFSVK